MAGSYLHCVDDDGRLLPPFELSDMLENGGDVWEAVEELYGMIWYLSAGDPERVEDARQHYEIGLSVSPIWKEYRTC